MFIRKNSVANWHGIYSFITIDIDSFITIDIDSFITIDIDSFITIAES